MLLFISNNLISEESLISVSRFFKKKSFRYERKELQLYKATKLETTRKGCASIDKANSHN